MPTKKKSSAKAPKWSAAASKISVNPNTKEMNYAKKVTDLLKESPCNFLAIKNQVDVLKDKGFTQLEESKSWDIKPGGNYFVTRNESAIMAFKIPKKSKFQGFTMVNSHCDFPALKLKRDPEKVVEGHYTTLNIEIYGGPIYYTWFDCPLGIAGRAYIETPKGIKSRYVNINRPVCMIPSLSVHQNREVNKGFDINPQIDMMPLFGSGEAGRVVDAIAKELRVDANDIIETELYLFRCEEPKFYGINKEYVAARGIDDQACAFGSLFGFIESKPKSNISVHMVFDNEEIGSSTRQGAASTFLMDTLSRISISLGLSKEDYYRMLSNTMALSADNGHALHPNRTEKTDITVRPYLGGGVALKYSAAFNYTTDSTSAAIVKKIASKNGVKLQEFFNRSDVTSGSALGKFLIPDVAVISADVGLPQISMHSSYETCGTRDLHEFKELTRVFFSSELKTLKDGSYDVN